MTTLDEFFEKRADLRRPRLHDWKVRLDQPGTSAAVEVSREATEFGQARPEMHVQFRENGNLLPQETVPWDDYLNSGLIRLRVRSVSPEQEAERFALGLRVALRKAEREFGDGYFNAVLLDLIEDSDLTRHAPIAEVMKYASANAPQREGGAYDSIHGLSRVDRRGNRRASGRT